MCGIVGVIGMIDAKDERVFKELLEIDSLRGRHSTGVVKVDSKGLVQTIKKAVDGIDFIKLNGAAINQGVNRVLIGHNRYATVGAVNDINAHPFSHGSFHAVHNGTLRNKYALKDNNKFDVDSDNMIYNISKEGIKTTAEKITGAWTVAGWNEEEQEFFMFRNKERPMNVAFSKCRKKMYFASEALMLEWILERNGIEYEEVLNLKEAQLLTMKPMGLTAAGKDTLSSNMTLEKLKYKVEYQNNYGGSKHGKKLSDWGLNAKDPFPISVTKVVETGNHVSKGITATIKLMCPPHNTFDISCYTVDKVNLLKDACDNDTIIEAKTLCQDYNTGMPKCYSMDVQKLSEKAKAAIEPEGEDTDFDDDIPFDDDNILFEADGIVIKNGLAFDSDTGLCIVPHATKWTDAQGKTFSDATFALSAASENGCCMCGDPFVKSEIIHWVGEMMGDASCEHCVEDLKKLYGE